MRIGDRVRFLNAVGGGIVSSFEKGGIVIVTDDDGFDVPTLTTEVVVVGETTNLNIPKRQSKQSYGLEEAEYINEDEDIDPADLPITFKPKPIERQGGDTLSLCLAFVPTQGSDILQSAIDVYLINDSNYYVDFAYMQREMGMCMLRKKGSLPPNSKVFLETKERSSLSEWEALYVQGIAYKEDTDFVLQPIINASVRVNLKKFYKTSSFVENLFFDSPALLHPLTESDEKSPFSEEALSEWKEVLNGNPSMSTTNHRQDTTYITKQTDGTLVVDLHIHALLDNTNGLTPNDLLNYQLDTFKQVMEEHHKILGQKIVFIHGKGEGVLRKAIITELRRNYKRCYYQDASFAEYGFGATQVTIQR